VETLLRETMRRVRQSCRHPVSGLAGGRWAGK